MDTAMDTDLVPSNKICRTCRKFIPTHLSFKNCDACREKNRLKEARRRREQNKYIERHKKMLMESVSMDEDDGRGFPTSENAISSGSKSSTSSSAGAVKPKIQQPRLLHELEGKEKKYAIREMKASLQKRIKDKGGIKLLVGQLAKNHVEGNVAEFQTASLLYEKLKRKAVRSSTAGKHLRFHGCHSIVAVSAINHDNRIAMVANDLRKISRISFGNCSTIERMSDGSWCSMLYDCKCLCAVGAGLSKQPKALKGVVECNGIVRVTAELDDSHPRGLEGQKITVHIHHK